MNTRLRHAERDLAVLDDGEVYTEIWVEVDGDSGGYAVADADDTTLRWTAPEKLARKLDLDPHAIVMAAEAIVDRVLHDR